MIYFEKTKKVRKKSPIEPFMLILLVKIFVI